MITLAEAYAMRCPQHEGGPWLRSCVDCHRIRARERYRAKHSGVRMQFRFIAPSEVEARAAQVQEKRRAFNRAYSTGFRKTDPVARVRYSARQKAGKAARAGRLTAQGCEVCGASAEKHHDDYGRPLDVRWLCRAHHAEHHANARRSNPQPTEATK